MISPLNVLNKWQFNSTKAPQNIDVHSHQIKGFENKDIEVELNQTKETIHASDLIWNSDITQNSIKRRVAALRRAFAGR